MTNWELLLSGKIYNDLSTDLFNRRIKAKKLFRHYNTTEDDQTALRSKILKDLFGSVGEKVWIEPDFRCEYGKNIHIGNNVYINFGCIILDCAKIEIGNDVFIGPNIGLYAANHAIDPQERIRGGCTGKPISIGNKVWLCGDVKITGGVKIGNNSVIGAGSIVTKDIPPNVVAAGNPCKVIRKITKEDKTGFNPLMD